MAKSEILGIGDMRANFAGVKDGMQTRTARRMLVAAGGVLKRKAKAIAQANGSRRTGAMIKNIAIKREPQAPPGTEQYHLGVRHGRNLSKKQKAKGSRLAVTGKGRIVKRYEDDPYYWRWVERGHKIVGREPAADGETTYQQKLRDGRVVTRKRKYSGSGLRARRRASTGSVPAKPFIAPALEQGRGEAIEAMGGALKKDLAKVLKT